MIRMAFAFIFAILIVTLTICGFISSRSKKPIGRSVCFFCLALIPPVLGNMIIILATKHDLALIGCYTYYIGMDLIMFALLWFAYEYCALGNNNDNRNFRLLAVIYTFLCIDVVQMLLNPFFRHAFKLQEIEAYGSPYFIMKPLLGQIYHRVVCYGALIFAVLIFVITILNVPKIYRERYTVILLSMVVGTLWQTFYIFSRTPVDQSMVGFAI